MKYEYEIIEAGFDTTDEFKDFLNNMGDSGWKLVDSGPPNALSKLWVFVREKNE